MHIHSGGTLLGDRLTLNVEDIVVEDSGLISVST